MKLGYKLRAAPTGSPHGSLLGMWSVDLGLGWSVGVGLDLCGDYFCDFLCGNCGVGLVCGVTVWIWVCVSLIWLLELELWWWLCGGGGCCGGDCVGDGCGEKK